MTVFRNTEMETGLSVAEFHVAWQYCPYESVVQKIQRAGGNAYVASPFAEPYPQDFEGICQQIEKLCKLEGKKYIYGYWNEPDSTMHRTGCYSEATKAVFKELEARVQQLCERLSDTLVIVTADHGHRDSAGVAIEDYPDILECLVRKPSIEPRALNLFVKEGMAQQLEEGFQKHFGDKFLLFTKEEVKEKQLFGTGEAHPRFDEMLGDYLAVAVSDLSIYNSKEEAERFIGVHAGLTEAEVLIPLIAVEIP